MSFDVNGTTWTPQTTLEHAQAMLDYINAERTAAGKGQIIASIANAIWLIELASGNLAADFDTKLEQAASSFDVSLADAQQILNMLPMVGTSLVPATYSTVTLSCTAAASGDAVIPAGSVAPYTNSINFLTDITTTVPAGTTVSITATCDTAGPVIVSPGQITAITGISNLQTVTNPANSIPGANAETIDQVRLRIIKGNTIQANIDGAILAIRSLAGIQNCNLYFNPDPVNDLTLPGGVVVPPRYCRIYIQGSSSKLASTYSNHLLLPTPTTAGQSQNYITLSGQSIPIYYDIATNQNVWIKVYYNQNKSTQPGFDIQIKNLILPLQYLLKIGDSVTSEQISNLLIDFPYATINGVQVSADNVTYSRNVTANANAVPTLDSARILIVGE